MRHESVPDMLERAATGHPSAAEELLPLVYDELRQLARAYMNRERPDHTLQATALVNEVCVRLLGAKTISWESRAHFFAVAARAMRRVLASHARDIRAAKRRAPGERISLSEIAEPHAGIDLLALDDVLAKLAQLNPQHATMVELRFFGGLTLEEMSLVLGMPKRTLERQWRGVQAWLAAELRHGGGPDGESR